MPNLPSLPAPRPAASAPGPGTQPAAPSRQGSAAEPAAIDAHALQTAHAGVQVPSSGSPLLDWLVRASPYLGLRERAASASRESPPTLPAALTSASLQAWVKEPGLSREEEAQREDVAARIKKAIGLGRQLTIGGDLDLSGCT